MYVYMYIHTYTYIHAYTNTHTHTHTCNRLQKVTTELISPNQAAFLKGRLIAGCTLLAHELVRDFNELLGKKCASK